MPPDEADRPMDRAALALDTARVELNDAIDDAKGKPHVQERLVAARRTVDRAVAELSWLGVDLEDARRARTCSTSHAPSAALETAA